MTARKKKTSPEPMLTSVARKLGQVAGVLANAAHGFAGGEALASAPATGQPIAPRASMKRPARRGAAAKKSRSTRVAAKSEKVAAPGQKRVKQKVTSGRKPSAKK